MLPGIKVICMCLDMNGGWLPRKINERYNGYLTIPTIHIISMILCMNQSFYWISFSYCFRIVFLFSGIKSHLPHKHKEQKTSTKQYKWLLLFLLYSTKVYKSTWLEAIKILCIHVWRVEKLNENMKSL